MAAAAVVTGAGEAMEVVAAAAVGTEVVEAMREVVLVGKMEVVEAMGRRRGAVGW